MSPTMANTFWFKRLLKYAAIPIGLLLAIFTAWAFMSGPRGADICGGVTLLLFVAYMINLHRSQARADREIAQRIRAEYPAELQPQLFEMYDRLKTKELEYLFPKVLDDARGNLKEAGKLAGLAESIGWKAFLENRW